MSISTDHDEEPRDTDQGPWVCLGDGRYRSASTGRLKYDPESDPEWQTAIKRIEAEWRARVAGG